MKLKNFISIHKNDEIVRCSCCGCFLLEESAIKVVEKYITVGKSFRSFFCKRCAPKYDCVLFLQDGTRYFKEQNIEVDHEGNPIAPEPKLQKAEDR